MAYQVLDTQLLQSAIKAAAQVTAALVEVGDEDARQDPQAMLDQLSDDLFQKLKVVADEDNKKLREEEKNNPAPRGGGGGWKKGGGGGNVESDGSMKLTWGKFKDKSIAEIYNISEEDAQENYGYGKSGAAWVEWLSKNKDPKMGYSAKRAKAFLDAKRG